MSLVRVAPIAAMLWLGVLSANASSESPSTATRTDSLVRTSGHQIEITHVSLESKVDFDSFTRHLEALLGRNDPTSLKTLVQTDPAAADARLAKMEGDQGLMIFWTTNHGVLLSLAGAPRHAAPAVVRVEYDQPSTLFGQFGNADVAATGRELDVKLASVIDHAAALAAQP